MSVAPTTLAAQWIWPNNAPTLPGSFAYFRKAFALQATSPVHIACVADSRYTLWLDGQCVGSGPARGVATHPNVDRYTLTLPPGEHTLAILAEYYGDSCSIFHTVRGGVLCQLVVDDAVIVSTDDSWRACSASAYTQLEGVLYPECFDARLEPEGWMLPEFDDTAWGHAVVLTDTPLAPPADCQPRPIPRLTDTVLYPQWLVDAGVCRDAVADVGTEPDIAASLWRAELHPAPPGVIAPALTLAARWCNDPITFTLAPGEAGYLALDFGRILLGSLALRMQGSAGTLVDMGYSELLVDGRVATKWQGLSTVDRIVLRDGETAHRFHRPRGFRYLMCRLANPGDQPTTVTLEALHAHETIYPTTRRGQWDSSDPLLNDIYHISVNTVQLCMMDAFMDCPWREQAQWLGDVHIEALVAYYGFGVYDLPRKALQEYIDSADPEGWVPGVAPATGGQLLPTWSLRFPVIAWEYFLHTGDQSMLPALYHATQRVLAWFARYENDDGLLAELPGWSFSDWTRIDSHHTDGTVQGWYLAAIEAGAALAKASGEVAQEAQYHREAARLRDAIVRSYWSPGRQAYRKYRLHSPVRPSATPAELIGQQENFLFSLLNVGSPEQRAAALQAVKGPTGRYLPHLGDFRAFTYTGQGAMTPDAAMQMIGTPFWSFFAVTALLHAGMTDEAVEYLRTCWGTILEHGDTTCWEGWDRHASLCHGWSAGPAYILPAYILGVKPLAPGFTQIAVRPHPGNLHWAKGTVPTPQGEITVAWEQTGTSFSLEVTAPAGVQVQVELDRVAPEKSRHVTVHNNP